MQNLLAWESNTTKGVVESKELSLATPEENKNSFWKERGLWLKKKKR